MSLEGLYYPAYTPGMGSRPRLQSVHPFRNLMAAGTNPHAAWSGGGGGSGHSSYGAESPDYDYHSGPSAHVPSGGSYSYHATADSGYGVPAAPHPPQKGPSGGGKKGAGKKGGGSGSSAMTALTLLSFFFFVNLLQGCLKDHMDSMNPTVMVMTTNIRRNRFNKMGEMNSREQSSGVSSSSTFSSNAANRANIVMQPADMVAAAAANSAAAMEAMKPGLSFPSPYSGIAGSLNNPFENQQQHQAGIAQPPSPPQVYQTNKPEPEVQYQRPYHDPHQPDPYEPHKQSIAPPQQPPPQPQYHPQPQQPITYTNQSYYQQPPPIYLSPQVELESHFHYPHTDYHYSQHQPSAPHQPNYHQPQPSYTDLSLPHQHPSTPRSPFYEYQHPPSPSPQVYKGHRDTPQHSPDNDNDSKYSHKYEMTSSQQNPQSPVPWSSYSASVISGPFRRASIVAVSPSPKWVSVPANVNDHTDFETDEDDSDTIPSDRYSESQYHKKFQ